MIVLPGRDALSPFRLDRLNLALSAAVPGVSARGTRRGPVRAALACVFVLHQFATPRGRHAATAVKPPPEGAAQLTRADAHVLLKAVPQLYHEGQRSR